MLPYHKMIRMFLEIIKKPFILFNYLFFLAPLLSGSAFPLVLGLMRDVPPCCEFRGRKRGLRRKLCRCFSFRSFSQPSARSFTLGSPFHFGLGLVWFGLEDDFDGITFWIWMHVVPRFFFFCYCLTTFLSNHYYFWLYLEKKHKNWIKIPTRPLPRKKGSAAIYKDLINLLTSLWVSFLLGVSEQDSKVTLWSNWMSTKPVFSGRRMTV